MTEPMTPERAREAIDAAWEKPRGIPQAHEIRPILEAADAIIAAEVRALPVLRTCGDCRHLDCTSKGELYCNHDDVTPQDSDPRVRHGDAPPSWCPLREGGG